MSTKLSSFLDLLTLTSIRLWALHEGTFDQVKVFFERNLSGKVSQNGKLWLVSKKTILSLKEDLFSRFSSSRSMSSIKSEKYTQSVWELVRAAGKSNVLSSLMAMTSASGLASGSGTAEADTMVSTERARRIDLM